MIALRNDDELDRLVAGAVARGGVLPKIHRALLPTKKSTTTTTATAAKFGF
jgi:hypothetical protein